jgi:hypothetical protein
VAAPAETKATVATVPELLDKDGMLVDVVGCVGIGVMRGVLTLEGQAAFAEKVYERVEQGDSLGSALFEMSFPGYWSGEAVTPEERQRWLRPVEEPAEIQELRAELCENEDDHDAFDELWLQVNALPIAGERKAEVMRRSLPSRSIEADDFDEDGIPTHASYAFKLPTRQELTLQQQQPLDQVPVAPLGRARRHLGGSRKRAGRRPGTRSSGSRASPDGRPPPPDLARRTRAARRGGAS